MLPSPALLNQVESFIQAKGKFSYYCLFLLGKNSGLRVSEAINFNLSLKKHQNLYLIQGKRHKNRAVFVDPQVIKTLKENHWKPHQTNRFSFAHFLQKLKKELNISKNIELTPHTLRRCFATYQSLNGMPLPVLQKVLGHASIRTTALYWKNTEIPWEKLFSDKWLNGKEPQEPPKPTENQPKENIIFQNQWKIFLNIQQKINIFIAENPKNSDQNLLERENQNLQAKIKQLEQENKEQKQTITNLQNNLEKALNDKQKVEKSLEKIQKEKETLLNLLTTDLQKQHNLVKKDTENRNIPKLHNQLITQIEISLKK